MVVIASYLCRLCQVLCAGVNDVAALLPGQHAVQEPLVLLAPLPIGCDEWLAASQQNSLEELIVNTATEYHYHHRLNPYLPQQEIYEYEFMPKKGNNGKIK